MGVAKMRITLPARGIGSDWKESGLDEMRTLASKRGARWVVCADGPCLYLSLFFRKREYLLHSFRGEMRKFASFEAIINLLRDEFGEAVFLVDARNFRRGRVRSPRPDRSEALMSVTKARL